MPSFMNTIIIEGPFMPEHAGHRESGHGVKGHYGALGIEMAAHFVIMYLVMYTMIATLDHFYFNNNTLWMTLMMVTPMALIMIDRKSTRLHSSHSCAPRMPSSA